MTSRASKLVDALLEWRARDRRTQKDAAEILSVVRKTYVAFESGQWLPPARERHFFAHTLHGVDPQLGLAFAHACGATTQTLGLPAENRAPALEDAQARLVYDAAVYAAAEANELPPKTARAVVAAVLAKLDGAGVTVVQAARLVRGTDAGTSTHKSTRDQK